MGAGESVFLHPAAGLEVTSDLQWVVYLELVLSSKPYLKGICAVKYRWLSKFLPRIKHKVQWIDREEPIKATKNVDTETKKPIKAKETSEQKERDVASQRARYLKRKSLKRQLKSL